MALEGALPLELGVVGPGGRALQLLVNIDVPDIERGLAFYRDAFGFELRRRLGSDFVELIGGSTRVYLLLHATGTSPFPGAREARAYAPHWTPVHLDVVVDDIATATARAEAAGATRESEIRAEPYGKLVLLRDPFGHGVCLLEFNAQGYGLLAARGGRPTNGNTALASHGSVARSSKYARYSFVLAPRHGPR